MPTGQKLVTSKWSSGNLVFKEKTVGNDAQVHFGLDASGLDVKLFGATSGCSALWDESADKLILTKASLSFSGAFTADVLDFTDVVIDHTGSNGPCFIRAGTYDSPVTHSDEDQSGMIRLYGETSADGSSYDRGIFVCLKTTGIKGIFPIAGLAEVLAQSGAGPTKVQAAQFIAHLNSATAKLATSGVTDGMFGIWAKVTANAGATIAAGAKVAAIWLDNQLYGDNINTTKEYTIYNTTGGTRPKAWAGFETSSSGWSYLFHFDDTAYDQEPVVSGDKTGGSKAFYLKVLLNTTQYAIQLYAV